MLRLRRLLLPLLLCLVQCTNVQNRSSTAGDTPGKTPEAALTSASSTPAATENSVAAFLKDADRQSETDEQRKEIRRALQDMLEKSPNELRRTRYSDYQGRPKKWSIVELLNHYFVPSPMVALDDRDFFRDFRSPAARAAIQASSTRLAAP
jgi:hypothetical protein